MGSISGGTTAANALLTTIDADTGYLRPNSIVGHIKIDAVEITGASGIAFEAGVADLSDLVGAEKTVTVPDGTMGLIVKTADLGAGEGTLYYAGDSTSGVPFALDATSQSTQIPGWTGGIDTNADEGLNVFSLVIGSGSLISSLEIWAFGPLGA